MINYHKNIKFLKTTQTFYFNLEVTEQRGIAESFSLKRLNLKFIIKNNAGNDLINLNAAAKFNT